MFRSAASWVALVVGLAGVASQTYLRRVRIMYDEQRAADIARVRDYLWYTRSIQIDTLLLHGCGVQEDVRSILRLVGYDPDQWILGALANDRDVAEG